MTIKYTTIQDDRLDIICRRIYGTEHGNVDKVLALNYGLAAQGPLYPVGLVILMPDPPKKAPRKAVVRLWS